MSGLAERYGRASQSSHLEVKPEPCDADVVIAAGFAARHKDQKSMAPKDEDSLGMMLMRCRQEWDRQRATIERSEARLDAEQAEAAAKGGTQAMAQHYTAEQQARTSRALIMVSMPTLQSTALALRRHALNRVTQRSMRIHPEEVARVSGNALDIWLDQRCNACQGRGKNGAFGTPQIICTECRGTKTRRRIFPSKSADEHALGEWLLAEMDRVAGNGGTAQRKMSQVLR